MEGLFKKHFVGQDGFIWWIGQIAPENTWGDNVFGIPLPSNDGQKGFGERYKVRIMGYHTAVPSELPDEELPWASVMYPVTAGGGGRCSSQTANLTQGTWVFGFFIDGENAQQPVIMGCLGYNDYNAVMAQIPDAKFVPFTGYTEKETIKSTTGVRADPEGGMVLDQSQSGGKSNNAHINESAQQQNTTDVASKVAKEDGQKKEPLSVASDCRPIPSSKIQQKIKNMMKEVEEVKRAKTEYIFSISKDTTEFDGKIQEIVTQTSQLIGADMKDILGQVQKNTTEKLNTGLKDTYYDVMPNARQELKKAVEEANDQIACQFRGLVNGLAGMLEDILGDIANKTVTTPPCMVDNMMGSMIGQLANSIQNSLTDIFGKINSLTNIPLEFAGDALGIIDDVLSFLNCEEQPGCSQVTEWSLWDGASSTSSGGFGDLTNIAKGFSDKFSKLKAPDFDFDMGFDDIFDKNKSDGCNTGPAACGPPIINFFGGKGRGAAGNVIVAQTGQVMGVDMVEYGYLYDEDVQAEIVDLCGKGQGAEAEPVIGEWTDSDGNVQTGVIAVNIVQPGINYLPNYDGSTGGNGRTWARPDDTTIEHSNGDLEIPVPPGRVVQVSPGDVVLLPSGTSIVTEALNPEEERTLAIQQAAAAAAAAAELSGEEVNSVTVGGVEIPVDPLTGQAVIIRPVVSGNETITGGISFTVQRPGRFTTPPRLTAAEMGIDDASVDAGVYPSAGASGGYPVIMYLCEVLVKNPGWNYSSEDTISIEPNQGAVAVPKFDEYGRIISIKMTQTGEGFTQVPDIWIRSDTGLNSELLPKFCIDRIAYDEVKEPTYQDKLVSVIDCVGKVPYPTPKPRVSPDTRRAFSIETFNK